MACSLEFVKESDWQNGQRKNPQGKHGSVIEALTLS